MEDLLASVLTFPPHPPPKEPLSDSSYDVAIRAQIAAVRKLAQKSLLQQAPGHESPLDILDPAKHTIPYTYILVAHTNAFDKGSKHFEPEWLWNKLTAYLQTFDARQIRYVGLEFTNIINAMASFAEDLGQNVLALAPIRDALLRLDPSGTVLTPTHLWLVKLALYSRAYEAALPLLEKFILFFPKLPAKDQPRQKYICDLSLAPQEYITINTGLNATMKPLDILDYFFCSGLVLIGLQRWEDALDYLESCITYPTKDGAVSKVMVEAYKKWVLVGILHWGRMPVLPRSTTAAAVKAYQIIAKPYDAVAQIFETGTAARLKAEIEHGRTIWEQDHNVGLIRLILADYQRFTIRNLGLVYSHISIPEIFNVTMSAETGTKLPDTAAVENLIQSMIQDEFLNARLSTTPGQPTILIFESGPVLSELQMQSELTAASSRITNLAQHVKHTDRSLTHEKEYIIYLKKMRSKASKMEGPDPGIVGDMDWTEDEELMSGVF